MLDPTCGYYYDVRVLVMIITLIMIPIDVTLVGRESDFKPLMAKAYASYKSSIIIM